MTLKCGCEGDICQGHKGTIGGNIVILTEIPCRELWALQRVVREARREHLLSGKDECLRQSSGAYCALCRAFKELENYWKVTDAQN